MSIDLSPDAAALADLNLFVRARFVEASETMTYLQVRGVWPSEKSGAWPDVANIVDGDYHERYRPSAAAISRAEEAIEGWLLDFLPDQEQRILVARWSVSLGAPSIAGSFRSWCKKTGRVRRTADRRVDAAFQSIANRLAQNSQSLREPDWHRVSPLLPEWGRDIDMVAERVRERQTAWHAPGAKVTDQPELRDTSWAEDQNRRRRERTQRKNDKAA